MKKMSAVRQTVMKLGRRFEHLENGLPAPGPAFLLQKFLRASQTMLLLF